MQLTLSSADSQKIQIDSVSAVRSQLLKGLIGDYDPKDEIPLPDIKSDILTKIVEYLTHYMFYVYLPPAHSQGIIVLL